MGQTADWVSVDLSQIAAALQRSSPPRAALEESIVKARSNTTEALASPCHAPTVAGDTRPRATVTRLKDAQRALNRLEKTLASLPPSSGGDRDSRVQSALRCITGGSSRATLSERVMKKIKLPAHRLATLAPHLPPDSKLSECAHLSHLVLLGRDDVPPYHADALLWSYVEASKGKRKGKGKVKGKGQEGAEGEWNHWLKHRGLARGRGALASDSRLSFPDCSGVSREDLMKAHREQATDLLEGCTDEWERELVERALSLSRAAKTDTAGDAPLASFALEPDSEDDSGSETQSMELDLESQVRKGKMSALEALSCPRLP